MMRLSEAGAGSSGNNAEDAEAQGTQSFLKATNRCCFLPKRLSVFIRG